MPKKEIEEEVQEKILTPETAEAGPEEAKEKEEKVVPPQIIRTMQKDIDELKGKVGMIEVGPQSAGKEVVKEKVRPEKIVEKMIEVGPQSSELRSSEVPLLIEEKNKEAPREIPIEEKVLEKLLQAIEARMSSAGGLAGKIARLNGAANQYFRSAPKAIIVSVIAVVIILLLVGGVSFGNLDKTLTAVNNFFKDAVTLQGSQPGTHANEVLLLDKNGNLAIYGHVETQGQLRSWVEQGVAPIVVESTTNIENLSADYLDNLSSQDFTLAFVTKNGNTTYEDVKLEGNVEVGKTLMVKGATKLLDNLFVYGTLGAFGGIETRGANLNLGSGTIVTTNRNLVPNFNADMVDSMNATDFDLNFITSNGNNTPNSISVGGLNTTGFFGQYGSFRMGGEREVGLIETKNWNISPAGHFYTKGSIKTDNSLSAGAQATFTGTPGSALSGATVYLNPASANSNAILLGVAVNGTEKLKVDAEGDLTVAGTALISGASTFSGNVILSSPANLTLNAGNLVVNKLATSSSVSAQATTSSSGSLAAGTYYYVVTVLNNNGETSSSTEVSATVDGATTTAVSVSWTAVSGASSYRVYGRAQGVQDQYWATASTSLIDTGTAGTAGTIPTTNTTGGNGTFYSGLSILGTTISRSILPETASYYSLGSASYPWLNVYTDILNATTANFAGNIIMSDDRWIGFSSSTGRMVFDDQTPDYFTIQDARLGIATTSPRFQLDVWGSASFGTTSDMNVPVLFVDSDNQKVGIASSTPSEAFSVAGNIIGSGNVVLYGTATSTISGPIAQPSGDLTIGSATGNLLLNPYGGDVGIATTSPSARLAVSGNVMIAGDLQFLGDQTISGSGTLTINPAGSLYLQTTSNYIDESGNLIVSGRVDAATLQYSGNITINATSSGATTVLIENNDGRAVANLQVEGDIQVDGGKLTLADGETIDAETADHIIIASGGSAVLDIISGGVNITGNATTSQRLYVTAGGAQIIGTVDITGNTTVTGTLHATATTTLDSYLIVDAGTLYVHPVLDRVGIASSTPSEKFSVAGNIMGSGNLALYGTATSTITGPLAVRTNQLVVNESGNVGIGNAAPTSKLTVMGDIASSAVGAATSTISSATSTLAGGLIVDTSTLYVMSDLNRIGIATTTPRYTLDVWGSLAVGTTTSPIFLADTGATGNTPGITIGADISMGSIQVASSSGAITFADMSVEASASAGTEESYSFQIDSNELFRIYAESDGAGGIQNRRVFSPSGVNFAVGTTTPRYTLDVWGDLAIGTSTGVTAPMNYPLLYVQSGEGGTSNGVGIGTTTLAGLLTVGTSTPALVVAPNGYVGIGTTTPSEALTIVGNIVGTGNMTVTGNYVTIAGDLMPSSPQTSDIGSPSYDWANIYVNNVYANNILAASSSIAGTVVAMFTINSDATEDATSTLRFYRGLDTPHAILNWDAGYDRFNLNFPLYLSNTGDSITAVSALNLTGNAASTWKTTAGNLTITAEVGHLVATSTDVRLTASTGDISATSSNAIYLATNNIERMRINSSGYVGIATTTPRYKLDVWGDMAIGTSTGTNVPALYVDSGDGGRIGIGTTTPAWKLTVSNSATTTTKAFIGITDELAGSNLKTWTMLVVSPLSYVGVGTSTPSTNLAVAGNIMGSGNVTFYGTAATTTIAGGLVVGTNTLWVPAGGNVGIGTVTPYYTLDVVGTGKFSTQVGVAGTATTTGTSLTFAGAGNLTTAAASTWKTTAGNLTITAEAGNLIATGTDIRLVASTGDISATSSNAIYLATNNAERLRINSTGRVGIGTTTFAGLLTVGTTTPALVVSPLSYVGIGTSTPSTNFAVQGNIMGSGNLVLYGTATSTITGPVELASSFRTAGNVYPAADVTYFLGSSAARWANIYAATTTIGDTGSALVIDTDDVRASGRLTISSGGTGDIILSPAGNLGIATTSPSAKLAVTGNVMIDGDLQFLAGRAFYRDHSFRCLQLEREPLVLIDGAGGQRGLFPGPGAQAAAGGLKREPAVPVRIEYHGGQEFPAAQRYLLRGLVARGQHFQQRDSAYDRNFGAGGDQPPRGGGFRQPPLGRARRPGGEHKYH